MDVARWLKTQWDRALAGVLVLLGLLAVLLGWLGLSDEVLPAAQIPYLASGVGLGMFALGVGATLWLSADMRDEWRKLDDIYQLIRDGSEEEPTGRAAMAPEPDSAPLVSTAGAAQTNGRRRLRASTRS